MDRLEKEKMTRQELGVKENGLMQSDPDFAEITDAFVFGEVYHHGNLNSRLRELLIIAVLCANQAAASLRQHAEIALNLGTPPELIKEVVYQSAPYVGISKAEEALSRLNQLFEERGIALPLKSQKTVSEETRSGDGIRTRAAIFGDGTYKAVQQAPEHMKHIQEYLCGYCFGDFYTRAGLDLKQRELLTLCLLAALGGCESQLKSHVMGNQAVGNDKSVMLAAISACMPYLGFPRTLNAITCINEINPE